MFHRVYFRGEDGHIYEAAYNDRHGWSNEHRKLVKCAKDSGIAAIVWNTQDNPEIRLYYLDEGHNLQEYAYSDGRWSSTGANLRQGPSPKQTSGIGAFMFGSFPDIRVYYETKDCKLQEMVFTSPHGWKEGVSFN
jgi:hypothetical protein